ncbi:MAG: DUF3783 domain-containing protein [Acutalibacteraceae bacterium]|jgi:hypothetical protein
MKVRIPKRTMILLYLPDDVPDSDLIRVALRRENLPFFELSAQQLKLTVQECFEGREASSLAENAPGEAMAVFCNLSDAQLDTALSALRGLPVGLKAIMTPTNRSWSMISLYEELCREREAIRRQRGQKAQEFQQHGD